jgi:epoxyqueuosine reductase
VPRTRPDHGYRPRQDILDRFPEVSGNAVNGLGETEWRKPSPFFWHPADKQTHGELQHYIVSQFRPDSMEDRSFRNPTVDRGPDIVAVAETRQPGTAADWTAAIKALALADEADLVGITTIGPENVYEGYEIAEPTAVMIGVAHDYDRLSQAPGSVENPEPYYDLHDQYNRAARVAARLTNHIREQGYDATPFLGPMGGALNMIPAAIAAGFGELGKHGSMINRTYGAGFRLSAVATDMPLIDDAPDRFGADEFCVSCQVCRNACPPDAISDEKRPVRGATKWYVDFDKCIPYFGEHLACGICIAVCPYTRPGIAPSLIAKMARRAERKSEE